MKQKYRFEKVQLQLLTYANNKNMIGAWGNGFFEGSVLKYEQGSESDAKAKKMQKSMSVAKNAGVFAGQWMGRGRRDHLNGG